MSATPIMPALNLPPLRDTQPLAAPPAAQTSPAVAGTLTKSAVQQMQSSRENEWIAHVNRAIWQDTRAQMAGPPPSFQVSLLQQVRDTQTDPILKDLDSDILPAAISDPHQTARNPKEHAPYKALQGMSEPAATDHKVELNV